MNQSAAIPIINRIAAFVLLGIVVYQSPAIIEAWRGGQPPSPNPAPVVVEWDSLVPDQRDRQQLASYLEAWSSMVVHTPNLGSYSDARKRADVALQKGGKLTGSLGDFDAALAKRLEHALGGNLDPGRSDLEPLTREFAVIAEELRQ